jgi:poly-gamma-glutamate capsule biosynthesis protein CapA/YwtB (metallophosphatase superfamily)
MNGDMLLHEGLWASARKDADRTGRKGREGMDYRPILADMKPVVSGADLAICHLETPVAPVGGPYSGYPLFSVPSSLLPALKWEGYDACTTASNHSVDQGFEGLKRTLDDLDRVGIAHAGTAETRAASRRPLLLEAGDVTVGLISATYGTNGLPLPEGKPWSVPLINTDRIEAMAHRARDRGADVVLVALHWGLEYQHAPTSDQEAIAAELTRSPYIDLVYGHHAHVVQPYDLVKGTWVVYGLGNAVAQQDTAVEGVYDGNTCRVTFTERPDGSFRVTRLEYIPTMITHYDGVHPMRWLNVARALTEPRYAGLRPALRATQQRVREVVGSLGAFRHSVTEGQ